MDQNKADRLVTVRASIPTYVGVHPLSHYESIEQSGNRWICIHRRRSVRQLIVVERLRHNSIEDFERLARLNHLNIARAIASYIFKEVLYVVYEYVELRIQDILPISEKEMSSITFQVMAAVHHLKRQNIAFQIGSVRLTPNGLVKIVLDWNFESRVDFPLMGIASAYVAFYIADLIALCVPVCAPTLDFIQELKLGQLPSMKHRFTAECTDQGLVKAACRYAVQLRLANDSGRYLKG